jgi:hypothetical protein
VLNAIACSKAFWWNGQRMSIPFSHLTLQEYLTARYIVDHRRIERWSRNTLEIALARSLLTGVWLNGDWQWCR